jgi:hypothetical protein
MSALTPDGIRRAIVERVNAGEGQANRAYLDHLDGVLRGLLWALTGEDPGTYLTEDLARIFTLAGIPHRVEGSRVVFAEPGDEEWPADPLALETTIGTPVYPVAPERGAGDGWTVTTDHTYPEASPVGPQRIMSRADITGFLGWLFGSAPAALVDQMEALRLVEATATKPGDSVTLTACFPGRSDRYEIRAKGADGRRWRAEAYTVERLVLLEDRE